ncbi:MAG TPA: BON domain-containing protein [Gemmataceae bacterium]|nr:BON domain-containing protein [Gemmataceae bacterium]
MATSVLDAPPQAAALLRECPVNDLRRLEVIESEFEVVITGIVTSYYLKQMAQETVRPAAAGRRLRNRVLVLAPK